MPQVCNGDEIQYGIWKPSDDVRVQGGMELRDGDSIELLYTGQKLIQCHPKDSYNFHNER